MPGTDFGFGLHGKVPIYRLLGPATVLLADRTETSPGPIDERSESAQRTSADHFDAADGAWSLPWLPPGEYSVTVVSEVGEATRQVALSPGSRRELVLTLDERRPAASIP